MKYVGFLSNQILGFPDLYKRFAEGVFKHRDKLNIFLEAADKLIELYNETKLAE